MGKKWARKLTPGGVVRVYRPGGGFGDCQGVYNVPLEPPFEIRDLAPGEYVARDEDGNEVPFTVLAGEEVATVLAGPDEPVPSKKEAANPNPGEAPRLHGRRRPVPNLPHYPAPDAGELEGEIAAKPEAKKAPARKRAPRKPAAKKAAPKRAAAKK